MKDSLDLVSAEVTACRLCPPLAPGHSRSEVSHQPALKRRRPAQRHRGPGSTVLMLAAGVLSIPGRAWDRRRLLVALLPRYALYVYAGTHLGGFDEVPRVWNGHPVESAHLLTHKSNTFSQNGEDGVIAAIFRLIGETTRRCCEFGAFDGVHLSNCRRLILEGWSALMIESDADRFAQLRRTYEDNPRVTCVHAYVDVEDNSLDAIAKRTRFDDLDFLSIDIDGLDYEIFESLDLTPRVVCVEVNAGHSPEAESPVSREVAKDNVGQPLKVFMRVADRKGYDLVCYTGNAFFVRRDAVAGSGLSAVTSSQAYQEFLQALSKPEREWLYRVNLGLVTPYVKFSNDCLTAEALGLGSRAVFLRSRAAANRRLRSLGRVLRGG